MATIEQHINLIKEANKITNRKTLYAVNSFKKGKYFSSIVKKAKALGYT